MTTGPTPQALIARAAGEELAELAAHFRIVIVQGPRQAGKTTLLNLHRAAHGGDYRSLDEADVRESADIDPESFVQDGARPMIIDEVQLGGDRLVRAIKLAVDSDRSPGQFILSGSTNFLTTPGISESLAGRAVFSELWPLSMAERTSNPGPGLIERALSDPRSFIGAISPWTRPEYLDLICVGGYPEVAAISNARIRQAWFSSYLQTIIARDLNTVTRLSDSGQLIRLLELAAARSAGLLVHQDLGRELGVSAATARRYLAYLEMIFLVAQVRPWFNNATARLTKTPKIFVTDTGLLSHLARISPSSISRPGNAALGGLLETFVYNELIKERASSDGFDIYHLRDRDGREVDFVCEGHDGRVVAIEVKASASPRADAARHLRWLRTKLGDRFAAGIVLYLGDRTLSLGDGIHLMPLSALWGHQPLQSSP